MNIEARKWFLSAALAGLIAVAPAIVMYGQNRPRSHSIRQQIHEDQQRLRSDSRQYGKKSPEVKEDRKQLRKDENRLREAMENAGHPHRRRYPNTL